MLEHSGRRVLLGEYMSTQLLRIFSLLLLSTSVIAAPMVRWGSLPGPLAVGDSAPLVDSAFLITSALVVGLIGYMSFQLS